LGAGGRPRQEELHGRQVLAIGGDQEEVHRTVPLLEVGVVHPGGPVGVRDPPLAGHLPQAELEVDLP
jgi:hypothetical protein